MGVGHESLEHILRKMLAGFPKWPDPAVNEGSCELVLWTGGSCGCFRHE